MGRLVGWADERTDGIKWMGWDGMLWDGVAMSVWASGKGEKKKDQLTTETGHKQPTLSSLHRRTNRCRATIIPPRPADGVIVCCVVRRQCLRG